MNRDQQFLLDVLLSAKIAVSYMAGRSRTDLENDLQLQDAIIRRLLIIGEASNRVSKKTQQGLPFIPWQLINELEKIISSED